MKAKILLLLLVWFCWIFLPCFAQAQTVAGYSLSYDTNSTVTITNATLTFTNDVRRNTDGTNGNSMVRFTQITNVTTRLSNMEGRTNQWNSGITNAQGTNGVSVTISNNILTVDGAGTLTNVVSVGTGTSLVQQVTGQRALLKSLRPGANVTISDDGTNVTVATGAGVGEANTASTSGPGFPLTLTKVGVDLPFRGVSNASNGLTISTNADSMILGVDSTIVVTNGASIGTGTNIFAGRSGGTLQFKRLLPGASVALADDGSNITISASGAGEANTASSVGIGLGWFFEKVGVDLRFRSVTNSGPISISLGGNTNIIIGFDGSTTFNASGATNIPSSGIVNSHFVDLLNTQIVGGLKTFTNHATFSSGRIVVGESNTAVTIQMVGGTRAEFGISNAGASPAISQRSDGLTTFNSFSNANINITADGTGTVSIGQRVNINGLLSMLGNRITNMASGIVATDAATVGQMNSSNASFIAKQTISLPVWLHNNPEQNKDSGSGNTNAFVADFDIGNSNLIMGFASTNGSAQHDFVRFGEATVPVNLTAFANPAMTVRVYGSVTGAATNKVDLTVRDLFNNSIYVTNALTTTSAGGLTAVTIPNTGMFSSNLAGHALLFQITGYAGFNSTSGVHRLIEMSGQ